MENSWINLLDTWLVVAVLFQLMLLFIIIGYQVGLPKERTTRNYKDINDTVLTVLMVLLSLLISFSFFMAGSRFDDRQKVIVQEANAIRTAVLYVDLYAEPEREAFREDFKNYVEARIAYFDAGRSPARIKAAIDIGQTHSRRIWVRTVRLARDPGQVSASNQMIPALTIMISLSGAQYMSEKRQMPDSVVIMLFLVALFTAFFAGYAGGVKGRIDWLVMGGFCLLISLVIYITLDLDRPRHGLINVGTRHQAILDLRTLLTEP